MNNEQIEIGKFIFCDDWPDEVLPTIRALADEFQWLVPPWCQHITVIWSPANENAMDCQLNSDYRIIRLRVGPSFFDDQPKHRKECFVHELIHGFIQPHDDYAQDAINHILPDDENPKLKSVVLEELRERNEQVTQDLAFCLTQYLNATVDKPTPKELQ